MAWFPNLADLPMSLGDHLHELRRRLVWPLVTIGIVFIVAFCFSDILKVAMLLPLRKAAVIAGEKVFMTVGLVHSHDQFAAFVNGTFNQVLAGFSSAESMNTGIKISGVLGVVVAIPVLLWNIWKFVAVGLNARERGLAFFFFPLGVMLFYIGLVLGFLFALPFFFAWLLEYAAKDPTMFFMLRQSDFIDDVIFWTMSTGLVMDVPWLVMVLMRLGIVGSATLTKFRKYVVGINVVLACCLCPSTDFVSVGLTFLPIQLLFEIGLFIGRFIEKKPAPPPDAAATG